MRILFALILTFFFCGTLTAQDEPETAKFYLGLSFGTSYSIGDFNDTNISNPNAGFAKNGRKFDLYGGKFLNDKTTVTGVLRYQVFNTEVEDLVEAFQVENPGVDFTASTENWQTYSLLFGLAYKVELTKRLNLFPRFGLGPMIVSSPGIDVSAPDATITTRFSRTEGTGAGLGYETGIGLQTNLGKHFSLMPTFTFSGGVVSIRDVITTTDNVIITSNYSPKVVSFNLGLSLAYRFY